MLAKAGSPAAQPIVLELLKLLKPCLFDCVSNRDEGPAQCKPMLLVLVGALRRV